MTIDLAKVIDINKETKYVDIITYTKNSLSKKYLYIPMRLIIRKANDLEVQEFNTYEQSMKYNL